MMIPMCLRVCVLTALALMPSTLAEYLPEEMECPEQDQIKKEFFFSRPPVPLGTPDRAMLTLPPLFETKISELPGRGMGVYSKSFIHRHTWLSEYEGEYVPLEEAEDRETYDYAWRVRQNGEDDRLIDGHDESLSNWLRYVNCGRHISEENVEMTMCYGRVFFITTKDILPGKELLMYCGDEYVENNLASSRTEYFNST